MKIQFIVSPDGSINTKFEGFVGETCMTEAAKIAKALADQGVILDVASFTRTGAVDASASEHPSLRDCHRS